ncbi:MAG: NADH-quinone oxidoreductase subunit J [Rectinemataceae bacterium]
MNTAFVIAGVIAIAATFLVIVQRNAVHALLYLIVSLFALAVTMLFLGAAFVAALEIIVYAGAIMVLFIFVVMMIGAASSALRPRAWILPALLGAVLLAEVFYVLTQRPGGLSLGSIAAITPKEVGMALFGPYVLGAEIAAFLLLAGLVGAYHLARRRIGDSGPAEKEESR